MEDSENTETEIMEETTEATVVASTEDKALEERARRQGWRPLDEYNGPKERWVDAKTFVEKGDHELPILRERFRKLDDRLATTETKLTSTERQLQEATKVLTQLVDMSKTAEERGYVRALQDIQKREAQAVREADENAYNKLQEEKAAIVEAHAKVTSVAPPAATNGVTPPKVDSTPDPMIESWVRNNPWFQSDRTLNAFACDQDTILQREHSGWSTEDRLAEVKRRVVAKFPEKFDMPRKAPPPVTISSAPPSSRTKGKTVKDLPEDAKRALEHFKKTIPNYKDIDYLKLYFPGEEISA